MCPLFAFLDFNPVMMLVLGAIAVMLFGERLPEVAKSIGKGLMEFKSGIRELQDELHKVVTSATSVVDAPIENKATSYREPEDREEATAPKFEPPPTT
jgi:sec-independent protein translocase protein TatA